MHVSYLLSVFFHLLAVAAWLGSMFFLVVVVVPHLRGTDRASGARFLRESGGRLRAMGWVAFLVFAVTGTFQLHVRGVRLASFSDATWLASDFGRAVVLKLALFVVVVVASAIHDFRVGPLAVEAAVSGDAARAERLRRAASAMGRANFVLALVLVALGVMFVRGFPSIE